MKHFISILVAIIFCTSSDAQMMNQAEIEKQIDTLFNGITGLIRWK